MDPSDEALVRGFRNGDDRAFEALYDRWQDWVAALAFRFTGDRDAALDVLQDAFAYLVRRRADLELRSAMKTFLYPVVKNLANDRRRATRRERPLSPEIQPAAPSAEAGGVDHLLAGLSDAQQEVVLMRFSDGMDLQGIADALQVPLGTVKSRLHSALEIIRSRHPNR